MGKVGNPEVVTLFMGMLSADTAMLQHAQSLLMEIYGALFLETPVTLWDHSRYYEKELGWPLFRKFVFFKNTIDPQDLPDVKTKTNEMENSLSIAGNRKINIDPGYLSLSKVVLASTKNYAHRIYLRNGIYGEITLYYQGGSYKPHIFTYRDYQEKDSVDMFMRARERLVRLLTVSQV